MENKIPEILLYPMAFGLWCIGLLFICLIVDAVKSWFKKDNL